MMHSPDIDYLVFTAAEYRFALPYYNLLQIVDVPQCTKLPGVEEEYRGCIDFMGEAVPLFDIRRKLGYPSFMEEIESLVHSLEGRRKDHLNWIENLKDVVNNNKEITVQTDPHQCAFGRWYDNFHTDSPALQTYLQLFDAPHKAIHQLAIKAKKLVNQGQHEEARKLIHKAEDVELRELLKLFDGVGEKIRKFTFEYAVIVDRQEKGKVALSVDGVRTFGKFNEIKNEIPVSCRIDDNFIDAIGRSEITGSTEDVLIVSLERLVNSLNGEGGDSSRGFAEEPH